MSTLHVLSFTRVWMLTPDVLSFTSCQFGQRLLGVAESRSAPVSCGAALCCVACPHVSLLAHQRAAPMSAQLPSQIGSLADVVLRHLAWFAHAHMPLPGQALDLVTSPGPLLHPVTLINVTLLSACSTLGIMMEEFTKSADIAADLLLSAEVDWARLFEPYPFFSLFKNFLQVICSRVAAGTLPGLTIVMWCQ